LGAAAGLGTLDVLPDRDGRVRRLPLLVQMGDELFPSLAAEVLRVATTGAGSHLVRADAGAPLSLRVGSRTTLLDANGEIWLNDASHAALPVVGAAEVSAGEVPTRLLSGRSVVVGVAAPGIGSTVTSPSGEALGAAVVYGQAGSQLLACAHLPRPQWAQGAEALVGALGALAPIMLSFRIRGFWLVLLGLALVAPVVAKGFWLIRERLPLFDALTPAMRFVAVFATLALVGYAVTERERRFMRRALSAFVSPNLVRYPTDHPAELRLRGKRRECSLLTTHLAGLMPLVERTATEACRSRRSRH